MYVWPETDEYSHEALDAIKMARMRESDGENAMIRWRQYDMTIAFSTSYYRTIALSQSYCRTVALSSSYCRVLAFSSSRSRILAIVLSHSRHRVVALSSSYYRILVIVLSRSCIHTLWILMCTHDGPYIIP
ncbi:hypothetical protein DPMN_097426 [Dreissena polymorpha]|uniref:Uncharacterized protein n=1 Tax=Dreissena polymorpha TaxID=45954 RepID=A0A9D4LBS0_DREPO|nr:hypothetical protein DPMN_097426 [Dreissena polymorpha]